MPKGYIFTSFRKIIYKKIWTELDHNHNNKIEFWTVQLEESQKEHEGCHSYESVEENTIPPKPFFLDQCEGTLMIAFALPLLFLSSVKDWLKELFFHTNNKI